METILEAAHVAPTAANMQPVKLLVVKSDEAKEKLAKAANIYSAPVAIIVCADTDKAWTRPFDGMKNNGYRCVNHYRSYDAYSYRTWLGLCLDLLL